MFSRNGNGFGHAPTLGHHDLDDDQLFARLDLEATPEHQIPLHFFNKDEARTQLPGHFLPDHKSSHRWSQHRDRPVAAEFFRQRRTKPLAAWHIL